MNSATAGWSETINRDVLPKLQGFVFQADGLATAVYVVALLALVALGIEALWLARRPPASARARWGAVALALMLALPAAIVFKSSYQAGASLPLLRPLELFNVLLAPLYSLWAGYDVSAVLTRDSRLRLAATLTLLLLLLVLLLARSGHRHRVLRFAGLALALALCAYPISYLGQAGARSAVLARAHAEGQALFEAKCQTVGAKRLHAKTMAEGIRLTRLRGEAGEERHESPQWPGAGIPRDRVGQAYIASFLDFEYMDSGDHPGWNSGFMNGRVTMSGFQFVDVEQADGTYRRYRLAASSPREGMVSEAIPASAAARHAVSYVTMDTAQERTHWVAGALVTVTDTQTGEVLGELRTAAFAPPSRRAFADPQRRNWMLARTCPVWKDVPDSMARLFAGELVEPLRGR